MGKNRERNTSMLIGILTYFGHICGKDKTTTRMKLAAACLCLLKHKFLRHNCAFYKIINIFT
jgi:hypothetical protein